MISRYRSIQDNVINTEGTWALGWRTVWKNSLERDIQMIPRDKNSRGFQRAVLMKTNTWAGKSRLSCPLTENKLSIFLFYYYSWDCIACVTLFCHILPPCMMTCLTRGLQQQDQVSSHEPSKAKSWCKSLISPSLSWVSQVFSHGDEKPTAYYPASFASCPNTDWFIYLFHRYLQCTWPCVENILTCVCECSEIYIS